MPFLIRLRRLSAVRYLSPDGLETTRRRQAARFATRQEAQLRMERLRWRLATRAGVIDEFDEEEPKGS